MAFAFFNFDLLESFTNHRLDNVTCHIQLITQGFTDGTYQLGQHDIVTTDIQLILFQRITLQKITWRYIVLTILDIESITGFQVSLYQLGQRSTGNRRENVVVLSQFILKRPYGIQRLFTQHCWFPPDRYSNADPT